QSRGQNDDVGRRPLAQFVGHRADRAELSRDLKSRARLEFGPKGRDHPLRGAAAEGVQGLHEDEFIAAISGSRVLGRWRARPPRQSNTALAIAAVTGPCAASPAPTGSISGRWITSTSTCGTSENFRIGYSVQLLLMMRARSKRTRSFKTQLVA